MITIDSTLYSKLENISKNVENRLRKKGIAVPVQHNDGSIQIGSYFIKKQLDRYQILENDKYVIADKINLPQTAAILANNLALNRFLDKDLLDKDRSYGYAEFEESLNRRLMKRLIKKDISRAEMLSIKCEIKKLKKENYKKTILMQFEKLMNINK